MSESLKHVAWRVRYKNNETMALNAHCWASVIRLVCGAVQQLPHCCTTLQRSAVHAGKQ